MVENILGVGALGKNHVSYWQTPDRPVPTVLASPCSNGTGPHSGYVLVELVQVNADA